jgi:hypothetical protein
MALTITNGNAALMNHLHWQSLLAKLSATVTGATVLALATLFDMVQNRNDPICIVLPKVAKVSTIKCHCH